jgi:dCTP deaminase
MILTRDKILAAIKAREIIIDPFDIDSLEAASYNVTLSPKIRVFREGLNEIDVTEIGMSPNGLEEITTIVNIPPKGYYLLKPGELVLGMTVETLTLPQDIGAWLQGRSRFARMGLMVHITASFIQPGICNRQVFEIYNASRNAIKMQAGARIAQIIFERCEGRAKYVGIFATQKDI